AMPNRDTAPVRRAGRYAELLERCIGGASVKDRRAAASRWIGVAAPTPRLRFKLVLPANSRAVLLRPLTAPELRVSRTDARLVVWHGSRLTRPRWASGHEEVAQMTVGASVRRLKLRRRSEEHTSELQSR